MRYSRNIIELAIAALAAMPAVCGSQGQATEDLALQIRDAYPVTVMDVMDGAKVIKPGTVLVVKKEGLLANPIGSKLGPYVNEYEDGIVRSSAFSRLKGGVLVPGPFKKRFEARPLSAEENVYLLDVEIKPDAVVFLVQSCGTCDPAAADPAHHPYRAKVAMHFVKRYLTATDLGHVKQAIGEILAVPDANGGQSAQVQQQDAPAPPAPPQTEPATVTPPEAQPLEPVHIGLGQTIVQVVAALGEPVKTVKLDTKEIYVYKDLKITFAKERVVNVE